MRNAFYYLTLALIIVLIVSCEKEEEHKENFISFNVENEKVTIFQNPVLNNDTSVYFEFAFGTSSYEGKTDTVYILRATLNQRNIMIEFPQVDSPQTFSIYRTDSFPCPSGVFQYVVKSAGKDGVLVYNTNSRLCDAKVYKEKVGELTLTKVNNKAREFEGTFWFKAYGYYHLTPTGYITPANTSINITEGKFYYSGLKIMF